MTKYLVLVFIIAFIVSCFHIDQVACTRQQGRIAYNKRRLRMNKRLSPPDPEAAISTAKVGLMGILAATSHTLQGETKFMDKAEPASTAPFVVPASISSNDDSWGAPVKAAAVPAAESKKVVAPAG